MSRMRSDAVQRQFTGACPTKKQCLEALFEQQSSKDVVSMLQEVLI